MTRLSLIGSALLASVTTAQAPRFSEVNEAVPDGIGQLTGSADFEGDGDIDLFSTAGVFLNENGYFRPGPRLPTGAEPGINQRSIAIADFTGDGRVDVLIGRAGGTPAGVALYKAPPPGGAEFLAQPAVVGAETLFELGAADFDGDGDLDVVAATASSGSPRWELLLNDGTGSFLVAGPLRWPVDPIAASWLGTGDFDGDGLADVFASTLNGPVWRRNLGAATFGATRMLGTAPIADSGAVGDFNGDGRDDIYLADVFGDEIVLSGSVGGPVAGTVRRTGIPGAPPVAVDLDADGIDDLVRSVVEVSGGTSGDLVIRSGSAGGLAALQTWFAETRFAYGSPTPYPGLAVLDVERDGDQDAVFAPGGAAPWILLNMGSTGLATVDKNVPPSFRAPFCEPGDLDGDGDPDLLRASIDTGVIKLESFLNNGRGVWSSTPTPAGSYTAPAIGSAQLRDVDADGDLDLFIKSTIASDSMRVLLNDGAGVFALGTTLPSAGPISSVLLEDFDGDGLIDVFASRPPASVFPPAPRNPILLLGVATPQGVAFAPPVAAGPASQLLDLACIDAEPDGDLDIVAASSGLFAASAPTLLLENDGTGSFTVLQPFAGADARLVAVGDLNLDGREDLVLGDEPWLWQGGTFVLHPRHPAPIAQISIADLDGDLLPDLLDAAGQWFRGDGSGSFSNPIVFVPHELSPSAGFGVRSMAVDLDADGDLDVLGPRVRLPGHFTIYSNLTRHLARDGLARAGASVELSIHGEPTDPWALAVSAPGSGPIALPPLGTFFLDPATLQVPLVGNIPASGRARVSLPVPIGLAGVTLSWQALLAPQPRFSNSVDTQILP